MGLFFILSIMHSTARQRVIRDAITGVCSIPVLSPREFLISLCLKRAIYFGHFVSLADKCRLSPLSQAVFEPIQTHPQWKKVSTLAYIGRNWIWFPGRVSPVPIEALYVNSDGNS